jgi:hypothetical protein
LLVTSLTLPIVKSKKKTTVKLLDTAETFDIAPIEDVGGSEAKGNRAPDTKINH